jgi:hypothetical protein
MYCSVPKDDATPILEVEIGERGHGDHEATGAHYPLANASRRPECLVGVA